MNLALKAKDYHEKALRIWIQIHNRRGEATSYNNLGVVYRSLGEHVKVKECYEEALAISIQIGDREGEEIGYVNLGTVFQSLGEYVRTKRKITCDQ